MAHGRDSFLEIALFIGALALAGLPTHSFAQIKFIETSAPRTSWVGFQAPAGVAASLVWTMPGTDGSANQCLATNGSGTLFWKSSSSANALDASDGSPASALWVDASGYVGVGTTAPISTLSNTVTNTADGFATGSATGSLTWLTGGTGYVGSFTNTGAASGNNGLLVRVKDTSAATRVLNLNVNGTDQMTVTGQGYVGIGTSLPTRPLEVVSTVVHSGGGTASQLSLRGSSTSTQKLNIGYDTSSNYGFIEAVQESVAWQNLALQPGGGYVGINKTNPTYSLDVNGVVHVSSDIYLEKGLSPYIGTIDSQDLRLGAGYSEKVRIQTSTGNVGIGISSPVAKLEVAGEVKFGNTSSTCDATSEGQQRYNSTSKQMEFCNGTNWTALGAVLSGTWCGAQSNNGGSTANCNGVNPGLSCPSGYTQTVINTTGGGGTVTTCIKN